MSADIVERLLDGRTKGAMGIRSIAAREIERLRKLLRESRKSHRYCDDSWYSCPKAEGECGDETAGTECRCGADEWNARIDAILGSTDQLAAAPCGCHYIDKSAGFHVPHCPYATADQQSGCASVQPSTTPRFAETFCSQCGGEFGPGDSGYSHCKNHRTADSADEVQK